MKEEELGELLGQLLEAQALITACVGGQGTASGSEDARGGSAAGLELVGCAVAVDPLAAAAAAAAVEDGGGAEVVVVPGERGHLIPAYHPSSAAAEEVEGGEADGSSNAGNSGQGGGAAAAAGISALAWAELGDSVGSGALSLLLADKAGQTGQLRVLRQLVEQVPRTADGRLTADAVARSLGLQHSATTAALGWIFAGSSVLEPAAAEMAETVGPRQAGGHEEAAQAVDAAGEAELAFRQEQVEQGLARLVTMLAPAGTVATAEAGAASPRGAPARPAAAPLPTTRQYWQAQADAVLPPDVARSWALLERQSAQQLVVLQGRTARGSEVAALRQENEALKAHLAALLNSPANKQLKLPPTLLLR